MTLGTIWERILAEQEVPSPAQSLVVGLIAAALVAAPFTWPLVRMLVTITHEGGHAFVALVTGRTLKGITLHRDTSGVTVSSGPPTGPGMVATLAAGYPASGVAGLASAWVLGTGHAVGFLYFVLVLLALMLLQIRNGYGLLVLLAAGGGVFAASWFGTDELLTWLAQLLCWLLLLAAPKPVLELYAARNRRSRTSDPAQLAGLTKIPQLLWTTGFLIITVGCLLGGAWLMLPVHDWVAALEPRLN